MPESQTSELSVVNQQNKNFLQQKHRRCGSESATVSTENLPIHVSSVLPITQENLLQQENLQRNVNFSMQQLISVTQNNNNDERYQQQSLILGLFFLYIKTF